MKAATLALASLLTVSAPAIEIQGNAFLMNAAEMANCRTQGGCTVVTKAWFESQMEEARRESCSLMKT